MMYAGLERNQDRFTWVGFGTYLLGAPLVHLAHGGRATLPSLGMRVATSLLLGVGVVNCVESRGEGGGCLIAVLGVLAFPAAIALDAAAFAYDRPEPPATAGVQSLVLPFYDPTRRAGMVSWAGTF